MAVANPSEPQAKKRFFTVEEANRMLPLVRRIVGDIVEQFRLVAELEQRLRPVFSRDRKPQKPDLYSEETEHSRAEFESQKAQLSELVAELAGLGVELKGADGLCDFPAMLDGQEVLLCWRLGEPEVMFWHDRQSGFAGRQPLPASESSSMTAQTPRFDSRGRS